MGSNPLAGSSTHGGVGERLKPTVCKIVALTGYAGSNPAPSTKRELTPGTGRHRIPSKVRPASGAERAHIAQLVEHALGKGEVIGSSPIVGSSEDNRHLARPVHRRQLLETVRRRGPAKDREDEHTWPR